MSTEDAMQEPILEIDPSAALVRQQAGALLLDVRAPDERAAGYPADSIALPVAELAARIGDVEPDRNREILTLCASGRRSLLALENLRLLGYAHARSVRGGFARWTQEGLPAARGELDPDFAERYSRHLLLPEVGVAGQQRLANARVVLVGAGGLGAPVALYLAAAGVGTLRLIDDDRVERSNLQRQVVHTDARIGVAKVESARITLAALNPTLRIETFAQRVDASNVEDLLRGHDVLIDGADNFPARYLLSAASLRLRIPLVYGAVHRFSGQASVFDPRRADSPCYRCLFPQPPSAAEAPNCSEAGVLGVLPGIIGMLQASETLKLLLGIGEPLVGRLLCHDALAGTFRELRLPRDPECAGCGAAAAFNGYADLSRTCAVP
jgi:sulfur-carrier protein adenylyltransferase/sulfurtransferase